MLLFLSLLCELAINLFSPKTNISRKMLSQFSEYFDTNFDVNDFMLEIYIDQLNFGILDRDAFDRKAKKAVELTEITKDSLYEKYRKKTKGTNLNKPKASERMLTNTTLDTPIKDSAITKTNERKVSSEKIERKIISNNTNAEKSEEPKGYSSAVDDLINDIEAIE